MTRTVELLAVLLICVCRPQLSAHPQEVINTNPNVTVGQIFDSWRSHDARTDRFHFQWTCHEWHAAGWMTGAPLISGDDLDSAQKILPPSEANFDVIVDLIVNRSPNGLLIHHRRNGPAFVRSKERYIDCETIEQLTESRVGFYRQYAGEKGHASLVGKTTVPVGQSALILPVMIAIHPWTTITALAAPERWQLVESGRMNGQTCLILETKLLPYSRSPLLGEGVWRLWLDPSMEFAIVKCEFQNGNQPIEEQQISYDHSTLGWVPIAWSRQMFHREGEHDVYRMEQCKVRHRTAGNSTLSIPEFEQVLPKGTLIVDRVSGRSWKSSNQDQARFGLGMSPLWGPHVPLVLTLCLLLVSGVIIMSSIVVRRRRFVLHSLKESVR